MTDKTDEVYIALLRGVNVGGNNKLPMKELASLCEACGCGDVKTYIQSGNVVFRLSGKKAAGFPKMLEKQISGQFGFNTTVILRSAVEMRAIAQNNPFFRPSIDPKSLHVIFLAAEPNLTNVVKLNPICTGDEAFSLRGREIFLHLPNGTGRSKMATYAFDKVLSTVGSMRNWQTVNKLVEIVDGF